MRWVWNIPILAIAAALAGGCVALPAPRLTLHSFAKISTTSDSVVADEPGELSAADETAAIHLALSDIVIVLDILGRLEQSRPDLRAELLRELSLADAKSAPAVVRRWQGKLAEIDAEDARRPLSKSDASEIAETTNAGNSTESPSAFGALWPFGASTTNPSRIGIPEHFSGQAGKETESNAPPDSDDAKLRDEPPTWDELMHALVAQTRDRAIGSEPDAARSRMQAAMLELLWQTAGRGGKASSPDPELWQQLAPAVEFCLSGKSSQRSPQEIIESLQVATELVRGPGRFHVRGLAFCRRIRGYDNTERLETSTFSSGQPVLLYSEVDHFSSEPVDGGFHTKLSSTLELLGPSGQCVWRQEFDAVEDQSDAPRRDFFMSHSFRLPASLKPGRYNLRLNLRDELADRTTSNSIPLSVR